MFVRFIVTAPVTVTMCTRGTTTVGCTTLQGSRHTKLYGRLADAFWSMAGLRLTTHTNTLNLEKGKCVPHELKNSLQKETYQTMYKSCFKFD